MILSTTTSWRPAAAPHGPTDSAPDPGSGGRTAPWSATGLPATATVLGYEDVHGPMHITGWGGRPSELPIVLLHGLGGSHLNWDLLAPQLLDLGPVMAVDLPGFGRSEPGGRQATVEENVGALVRFLEWLDRPAIVVGNSMGGMIGILAAALRPDLVERLALLGPALPMARVPAAPASARAADLFLAFSGTLMPSMLRRTDLERQVRLAFRYCGVDPDRLPPDHIHRTMALITEREDVIGMDKALVTAARSLVRVLGRPQRYWDDMASVQCPVLLLHGQSDRLVPAANARQAARRLPHWTYVEYPASGHLLQQEHPEAVASHIRRWSECQARISAA